MTQVGGVGGVRPLRCLSAKLRAQSRMRSLNSRMALASAPVLAINSADDLVNPPELGIVEKLIPRVKHARFVLLPITDKTRGHGTHTIPAIWGDTLRAFLETLRAPGGG